MPYYCKSGFWSLLTFHSVEGLTFSFFILNNSELLDDFKYDGYSSVKSEKIAVLATKNLFQIKLKLYHL